ncbi:HNH endonuclease [Burkholderia anthina]
MCVVCAFDFGTKYGALGEGFIHVHHLRPLSQIKEEHEVDPIADLRPVCPNCHAMLHRGSRVLTVEELKQLIVAR